MGKSAFIGIGVVVVIILGGILVASQTQNDGTGTDGDSDIIPNVVLETADGERVSLLTAIDKPAVVNIWASWCPFCVHELPDFNKFAQEQTGSIDVFIVNRGESSEEGEAFLEEINLSENAMRVVYDESEALYRGIGGFSMPETLVVDAQGKVLHHKRGPLTKAELDALVTSLNL